MDDSFAAQGQQGEPVCPRHPDRPSHVRCQRCGRPACPECLHQAPVGFQCVDCVRAAQASHARQRRGRRTQFGAPRGRVSQPVVTFTVIGLCAVVYVLQLIPGSPVTELLWYAPLHTSDWAFEPWRMLTSSVLHSPSSAMHIVFNMLALWFVGRVIEPAIGWWRYLLLLVLSAFGGSVAVLFLSPMGVPTVGASGAVFGLFGALFILLRAAGGQTGGILALIGVNVVIGFLIPQISWQGHLGGLITGVLCALAIAKAPRGPRRTLWQGSGLALIGLGLCALTAVGIPLVGP